MSVYLSLDWEEEGVGAYSKLGAYSRWALIRGWALIRINTIILSSSLLAHFFYIDLARFFIALLFVLIMIYIT